MLPVVVGAAQVPVVVAGNVILPVVDGVVLPYTLRSAMDPCQAFVPVAVPPAARLVLGVNVVPTMDVAHSC